MAFVGGDTQVSTMAKVKAGDRIILKEGLSKVIAVGEVIEQHGCASGHDDKDWLRDFDGWDLRAYCYVRWHIPPEPITTKGLTIATIQQVRKPYLKQIAEKVIEEVVPKTEYDSEPDPTDLVDDEAIITMLIKEGLRPSAAEDLTATFDRIRRLAKYYYKCCRWEDIREHETRTYLIVPLLQALGWAEQQMKIELAFKGGRVDIACFPKPYGRNTANTECTLILESKGFSQGLTYAHEQAKGYAKEFPKCQTVVVSNGYCYKAYRRGGGGAFEEEPHAYLNLLRPRDRYPLNPQRVYGALELLKLLLP
jgi:hypothetical protein